MKPSVKFVSRINDSFSKKKLWVNFLFVKTPNQGGGFTIAQTLRDKRQIVTEISGGHLCTCLQLSQIFQSRQTGPTEI